MQALQFFKDKKILSWALYDWANSAFATSVMAAFFPIYFKKFWSTGVDPNISSSRLAFSIGIASFIVAILAPFLGAIADQINAKKRFLFFFFVMGIISTGALTFLAQGHWQVAVLIYAVATIGFSGSNIFYDALLIFVSNKKNVDSVSAFGFSLGYLGGGLLYLLNAVMVMYPSFFGLANESEAIKISFIIVAFWWGLFAIPLFLFLPEEKKSNNDTFFISLKKGLSRLKKTFGKLKNLKVTFLFLISYWCYIDGVDTIVRLAGDYAIDIGISTNVLLASFLIVQFVAFPSTIIYIYIFEKRWGAKAGIMTAIMLYICICIWGYFVNSGPQFLILAFGIGAIQGGIQSLSRSFFTKIIPTNSPTEFFGFYNMLGKFAAVFGPLLYGLARQYTKSPRESILSIIVLFVLGAVLLYFVDEEEGQRAAQELAQEIEAET
jgi:UMF1 family MFS transporter